MKIFLLTCLFILFSCTKNGKDYQLLITKQTHSLNLHIDEKQKVYEVSSDLMIGETMSLSKFESDEKVLHGTKDQKNNYWTFIDGKKAKIQEVFIAPYYGMFSYNILQRVKKTGAELLNPACPFSTQFLFLAIMDTGEPLFGCIEEKSPQKD